MAENIGNGIVIPDKGSRDWYSTIRSNYIIFNDNLSKAKNAVTVNEEQTITAKKTITNTFDFTSYHPIIFSATSGNASILRTLDLQKGTGAVGNETWSYLEIVNKNEDGTVVPTNKTRFGTVGVIIEPNGDIESFIKAYKNVADSEAYERIEIKYNFETQTFTTYAPTPPADDNSTQIATTEWVNALTINNIVSFDEATSLATEIIYG